VGEPEVAARAEVHVEYDRVARGGRVGENPRLAFLLGPALLGDRPKIRFQPELERLRHVEQPAPRRPGRVGRCLRGDGLRLEDPGRPGYDADRRQGSQRDPGPPGSPTPPPPGTLHAASLRVVIFPSRGGGLPMSRLAVLTLLAALPAGGAAQRGDWPMPAKDYAATRYSDLTEITGANASRLRPVWSFSTGVLGGHEGQPLVVDHTMYVVTPYPNVLYAFD